MIPENDVGGTPTVSGCIFTRNSATNRFPGNGGGIDNAGTLTVSNSAFTSNTASASNGNGVVYWRLAAGR
jgi:hypothetical protein